jgi:hypothetical protein
LVRLSEQMTQVVNAPAATLPFNAGRMHEGDFKDPGIWPVSLCVH